MIGAMFDRSVEPEPCGAQDWGWWDDGVHVVLYGTCRKPKGHATYWHAEWDNDGRLLAGWSGRPDRRAPVDAPLWDPPDTVTADGPGPAAAPTANDDRSQSS